MLLPCTAMYCQGSIFQIQPRAAVWRFGGRWACFGNALPDACRFTCFNCHDLSMDSSCDYKIEQFWTVFPQDHHRPWICLRGSQQIFTIDSPHGGFSIGKIKHHLKQTQVSDPVFSHGKSQSRRGLKLKWSIQSAAGDIPSVFWAGHRR